MKREFLVPAALALSLAACSGNPLNNGSTDGSSGSTDGGITSSGDLPPGTASPTPSTDIVRYEATSTTDTGNGYARNVTYDSVHDTFTVTNLAFDGGNTYTRGTAVASLGPYAVYEAASSYADTSTGAPIDQFLYRALYGVGPNGKTQFAIVRTGAYAGYGFGGFVYTRTGGVTLPTTGQADFTGPYAALRDFNGTSGIEYVTGDVEMAIDFNGFTPTGDAQSGTAITGTITNRAIFDVNGNDITANVLAALSSTTGVTQTVLPTLVFDTAPGAMTVNGEISGTIGSRVVSTAGVTSFESGKFYGIVADTDATNGQTADQIVGVIVITSTDPRATNVTTRETGGFILSRP